MDLNESWRENDANFKSVQYFTFHNLCCSVHPFFFLHTVIRNILFTFATQSPSDSIYFLLADREREILDCQLRKINQTNIHVYDIHRQQV